MVISQTTAPFSVLEMQKYEKLVDLADDKGHFLHAAPYAEPPMYAPAGRQGLTIIFPSDSTFQRQLKDKREI